MKVGRSNRLGDRTLPWGVGGACYPPPWGGREDTPASSRGQRPALRFDVLCLPANILPPSRSKTQPSFVQSGSAPRSPGSPSCGTERRFRPGVAEGFRPGELDSSWPVTPWWGNGGWKQWVESSPRRPTNAGPLPPASLRTVWASRGGAGWKGPRAFPPRPPLTNAPPSTRALGASRMVHRVVGESPSIPPR